MIDSPYPETAQDALARWDSGESLFTIEMGGLGPGYEQCIQIVVFEIIRAQGEKPVPEKPGPDWHDAAIRRIDKDLGLSGAQVGAAKSLAYHALCRGWRATMKEVPNDRHIQVSKHFPRLATA